MYHSDSCCQDCVCGSLSQIILKLQPRHIAFGLQTHSTTTVQRAPAAMFTSMSVFSFLYLGLVSGAGGGGCFCATGVVSSGDQTQISVACMREGDRISHLLHHMRKTHQRLQQICVESTAACDYFSFLLKKTKQKKKMQSKSERWIDSSKSKQQLRPAAQSHSWGLRMQHDQNNPGLFDWRDDDDLVLRFPPLELKGL